MGLLVVESFDVNLEAQAAWMLPPFWRFDFRLVAGAAKREVLSPCR